MPTCSKAFFCNVRRALGRLLRFRPGQVTATLTAAGTSLFSEAYSRHTDKQSASSTHWYPILIQHTPPQNNKPSKVTEQRSGLKVGQANRSVLAAHRFAVC